MVEAVSLSFTMALHSSRAMPEVVLLKSEDTFWKMICWKQLLRFLTIFSITQELPPIFGCFLIRKPELSVRVRFSLSMQTDCLREEEKLLETKEMIYLRNKSLRLHVFLVTLERMRLARFTTMRILDIQRLRLNVRFLMKMEILF